MAQQEFYKKIKDLKNETLTDKTNNDLIKITANYEETIEIFKEYIKFLFDKLAKGVTTNYTPLMELGNKAEISTLEEKIKTLKNYEELQNRFKTLFDENKKLKDTKFQILKKINELKNKLFEQNNPTSFSKSKGDILQEKNELFEKYIRKFIG
ncbi:36134_t:CDS:1, partial [Racocetra persica]